MARDGSRRRRIGCSVQRRLAPACCLLLSIATAPVHAASTDRPGAAERAILALHDQRAWEAAGANWLDTAYPRRSDRRMKVRIEPLFVGMANILQRCGIPAREVRDDHRSIAVAADFHLGADLPDLKLHFGKRAAEPMGAFFASHKGVRWAVVMPLDRFTLRIEGGKDSEFGYMAIAGLQWRHPDKPIAVGFGIPARLKRADGELAAIAQLRLQFD